MAVDDQYEVTISWTGHNAWDAKLQGWKVYAVSADAQPIYNRGTLVATVEPTARSATFRLKQGRWTFRVIAYGAKGEEKALGTIIREETRVDGSRVKTSIAQPGTSDGIMGATDAPAVNIAAPAKEGDDQSEKLQLVEGPSIHRGKLIAELPRYHEGFDGDAGAPMHMERHPLPMVGMGQQDTRSVYVRGAARLQSGDAQQMQFKMPDMDDAALLEICSVLATGAAVQKTNWPAAASTDEWEEDNSDGLRAREIPTGAAAGTEWEDKVGGLLEDVSTVCTYLPKLVIESDEVNLGARLRGVLDIYDEWQRKADAIADVDPGRFGVPMAPGLDLDLAGTPESIEWLGEMVRSDGKFCSPLRQVRWYAKWGTSSPISMTYVPYRPGMWIFDAQYVRVKCEVEDYAGMAQLICPKLFANLRVKYQRQMGEGEQVPGGTPSVQVNLDYDRVLGGGGTDVSPFLNKMVVLLQSRTAGRYVYVSSKAPSGSPPSFQVTHEDFSGATPGTATDFDWMVYGY